MDASQLANMSTAQKEELMRTVQQQVALANMQELLTVSIFTDFCYEIYLFERSGAKIGRRLT
jgi:hypothetical protein